MATYTAWKATPSSICRTRKATHQPKALGRPLYRVQAGSGAHPASYPMSTGGHFPGDKVAGASSWPVKNAWLYTSIPQYVLMMWCLAKHRDDFTDDNSLEIERILKYVFSFYILES
jgi:hypothetical protein